MADLETGSIEWASRQIIGYKALRKSYQLYARTLQRLLGKVTRSLAPTAIVQARAKTIESFADKIGRKVQKYADPVHQLTDLCGARVIVETEAEVEAISAFIEDHFTIDWPNSVDASQRLKPTEFGYRSIHYIVSFKAGMFRAKGVRLTIPPEVEYLKAEIQVRTLLEHAWADINHRICYKSKFDLPESHQREFAGVAAVLWGADKRFSRILGDFRTYCSSYGKYAPPEEIKQQIPFWQMVLENDPDNAQLAHRIAKMQIAIGDFAKAVDILTPTAESSGATAAVLRDLGVALCKSHRKKDSSSIQEYRKGQRYLESACRLDPADADAFASLAGTWKGLDDKKATEYYRRAYEVDPSDPYPLENYLECRVVADRHLGAVYCTSPMISAAIQRCRDQAEVGVNMPWAYYSMGKLSMLLGRGHERESIFCYCKAVELSSDSWMIETSLRSVDRLATASKHMPAYEQIRRLLVVGWARRDPSNPEAAGRLAELSTDKVDKFADRTPADWTAIILSGLKSAKGGQTDQNGESFAQTEQAVRLTLDQIPEKEKELT